MTLDEFFSAIKKGDELQVKVMLDQDPALAEAKTSQGIPAVLLAMYYGEPALAQTLADRCLALDVFSSAACGRLQTLQSLVNAHPELANAVGVDGFQPLGLAAFFGQCHAAEFLLSSGAEVNSASRNPMRVMPLHSAVARQDIEIATLLLEHGAQVNAVQANDFTPLHAAAQNGQKDMVLLLLDYGAQVNARSEDSSTPLAMALKEGHTATADLLREFGGI